jgi:Rnl2 family RNA ligase
MLFKKYPSIENHYRTKYINMFAEHDLNNMEFILQEKLDGANFQIYITKDNHHFGKRSSALGPEASFYNYQEVTKGLEPLIQKIQGDMGEGCTVLYAELYGGNVQKRVSYQEEKKVSIYDGCFIYNDVELWLTIEGLEKLVPAEYLVPTVKKVKGIYDALEFDVEKLTTMAGDPDWDPYQNKMSEGVVIKPYTKVILDRNDSPFSLKLKSELFNDKMKVKTKKPVAEMSIEGMKLMSEYQSYLNKNRVADYMGKEGEIESPKQIGEYIKGIGSDALGDFLKDHPEFNDLDEKEQKRIKSVVGKCIAPLLKEYL